MITAGPTREAIDPVRYISNRSSGKMGYALARSAKQRGHDVCLISGPVALKPPAGVALIRVATAAEMLSAVKKHLRTCDALVMAAAVADWRPGHVSAHKLKKRTMSRVLRLVKTPDILKAIRALKGRRLFVGFAAETRDVVAEASRKLKEKRLDLIVANDVSKTDAGFEVDTNRVTLLSPEGRRDLPLMSKQRVAGRIIGWIERTAEGTPAR